MPETVPVCPRSGKWFRSCQFEPRFDRAEPRALTEDELFWLDLSDRVAAIKAARRTIYVHDVCVRCGRKVVRDA